MTKTEKLLLAVAAVFFAVALWLAPQNSTARRVETAYEQPLAGASSAADDADGAVYVTLVRRIDINSADAAALTALPGVGKVTAEAIVAWREEHGPFASVEELLLVPGLNEATLDAILAAGEG